MKKLLLSAFAVAAISISAQTNVSYDFEAPTYTVGPITGQPGWGVTNGALGTAAVSNEQANPGTQSLKISGLNGTAHNATGVVSTKVNVLSPVVTFMFNGYFLPAPTAGDECDFFVSPQDPDNQSIAGRMNFTYDGKIQIIDIDPATLQLGYIDTGATFTRSAWHTYRMELDFSNGTITYYQDNTQIYQGGTIGATNKVGNVAITHDNYNSAAYFDGITYFAGALSTTEMSKVEYKLYPNPTTDIINISLKGKIKSAQIYDMGGKVVNARFVDKSANIQHLAPGVYQLVLETDAGKIVDRFIKK